MGPDIPPISQEDFDKINQPESEPSTPTEEAQIGKSRTISGVEYSVTTPSNESQGDEGLPEIGDWDNPEMLIRERSVSMSVLSRQRSDAVIDEEPESPPSTSSLVGRVSFSSSSNPGADSVKSAISHTSVLPEEDPMTHLRTFNTIYKQLEGIESFSESDDKKINDLHDALNNFKKGLKNPPSELKGMIEDMENKVQNLLDNKTFRYEVAEYLTKLPDKNLANSLKPVLSRSDNKDALKEFKKFYNRYEDAKKTFMIDVSRSRVELFVGFLKEVYPKTEDEEYEDILDDMITEALHDYPETFTKINELLAKFGQTLPSTEDYSIADLKDFRKRIYDDSIFRKFVENPREVGITGVMDIIGNNKLAIDVVALINEASKRANL